MIRHNIENALLIGRPPRPPANSMIQPIAYVVRPFEQCVLTAGSELNLCEAKATRLKQELQYFYLLVRLLIKI